MNRDEILSVRKSLIEDQIKRLEDFSYGLMKWFATSLFVLNGGALIASVGVEEVRDDVIVEIGAYFAVGIGAAMIGGFVLGAAYSLAAIHLTERAWTGEIFAVKSIKADSMSRPGGGVFLLALVFMLLSAAALILGILEISDVVRLKGVS